MIRSGTLPMFDWNHPATLNQLWSTIARKTHGGTLDMLSVRYAKGENFIAGLTFFNNYLFYNYAYVGTLLSILGIVWLWLKFR